MTAGGPFAGFLLRVLRPVTLMAGGLVVTAAALLWCTSLGSGTGAWPAAGRMALLGHGLGLAFTPATAAAIAAVGPDQSGMAAAGLSALRQTGGALGPAVLGALFTSCAVGALPAALARHGVTGPGRAAVLGQVRRVRLSRAAARHYGGGHGAAVQSAFADAQGRALHAAAVAGAGALVLAALAVLLIEHGPRLRDGRA